MGHREFVGDIEALLKFPSAPECLVSVLREKTLISLQERLCGQVEVSAACRNVPVEQHTVSGIPVCGWGLSLLGSCEWSFPPLKPWPVRW